MSESSESKLDRIENILLSAATRLDQVSQQQASVKPIDIGQGATESMRQIEKAVSHLIGAIGDFMREDRSQAKEDRAIIRGLQSENQRILEYLFRQKQKAPLTLVGVHETREIPGSELIPMLIAISDRDWQRFKEVEAQFVERYSIEAWEDFFNFRLKPALDKDSDRWLLVQWCSTGIVSVKAIEEDKIASLEVLMKKLDRDFEQMKIDLKEFQWHTSSMLNKLDQAIAILNKGEDTSSPVNNDS
jgi:hypothetical protein